MPHANRPAPGNRIAPGNQIAHGDRVAPRNRIAGRRFLIMLLWAAPGAATPLAAQDADHAPAPVLRVARDQPQLGALRNPTESIQESDTTAPHLSSRRTASDWVQLTGNGRPGEEDLGGVDASADPPLPPARPNRVATRPQVERRITPGDGWVARGQLQRKPLPESTAVIEEMPVGPVLDGEAALAENVGQVSNQPNSLEEPRISKRQVENLPREGFSSNQRSLRQQEQNERFEADVPPADEAEQDASDALSPDEDGWLEIVPESIGSEPIPIDQEPVWSDDASEETRNDRQPVRQQATKPDATPQPDETPQRDQTPEREQAPEREPVLETESAYEPPSDGAYGRRGDAGSRQLEMRRPRELRSRDTALRDPAPRDSEPRTVESGDAYERNAPRVADRRMQPSLEAESVDPHEAELLPQGDPAPIITAAARRLERPIEQCLQYYHQRPENARERTPWGMLHAILPYGLDATIDAGPRRYNAIAWLAGNNPTRNLRLLTVSRSGRIEARTGVGLQGHQAQLLAIFAQVGVPIDYPLHVNGRRFTVGDLVQSEMAACRAGDELTFTLIGLAHYLPTDTTWRSSDGEHWDFERLIREELSQPVVGAACGGTHRLMGLSYALTQRRREGLPEEGQWERAAIFINDFVEYAWRLQNRDGSFSTAWFEGREDNNDLDRKIQTSGHIMEWLVFNSTDEQLQDGRVDRGIAFLAGAMLNNRGNQWQVGPKGHALRAMSLYHRRVFGSDQPWMSARTAARSRTRR